MRERVAWADVAKGVAMLLIVLHHSAMLGAGDGLIDRRWLKVDDVLQPLPVPTLFLVAGLFAAPLLRQSWRRLLTGRVGTLVWLFVVWSLVRFVFFAVVPQPVDPDESTLGNLLLAPVWPITGLWFLHALVVCLVAARLLAGRVPVWAQLTGAAVLSAVLTSSATGVHLENLSHQGAATCLVFFLVGCHGRERILRAVPQVTPLRLAGLGAVAVAGVAVVHVEGRSIPALVLAVTAVVVAGGCGAAHLVAPTAPGRALAFVGRHTLVIYVVHVLAIAAVLVAVDPLVGEPERALAIVLPVLVAGAAVILSLGAFAALRRVPWLFSPPRLPVRAPVPLVPADVVARDSAPLA